MRNLLNITRCGLSAIVGVVALAVPPETAWAQSRAQRDGWAADCAALGGSMNWDTGQCVGANTGSASGGAGGYTTEQQAMLDLAGQMGSLFGSWMRQSFEQDARQSEINRIQRAWEAERARERAAIAAEEQRQRNQALLASMQGTIGSSELPMRDIGSQGGLQMRTTEDMTFSSPNAAAGQPGASVSDPMQVATDAYLTALQAHNAAERALTTRQSTLAVGNQLVNEAAREVVAQRERVAALAAGSEQRRIEEARLEQVEGRLADALRLRDQAQRSADVARVEVERSRQALATTEARRRTFGDGASTQEGSVTSSEPHTDTALVDLRRPGAVSDPVHTDTSVVDARGHIGSQFSNLPRLEEVENSAGRQAWLRGMDAVANSDYELAAAWFGTALQRDPTNAAIARMVDGTSFVRDQRRVRAANGALVSSPPETLTAPTDADLELLREDIEAGAWQIWETMTVQERSSLRVLDVEDAQYREMLSWTPLPQESPQRAAPTSPYTTWPPAGVGEAPRH